MKDDNFLPYKQMVDALKEYFFVIAFKEIPREKKSGTCYGYLGSLYSSH